MEPVKHPKGWGYELWIVNNKNYCGKILHFNKDKKCSWHYHKLKHETFYVQQGTIELLHGWNDDINKAEKIILEQGMSFEIPTGMKHQMRGLTDADMYEFSTTHFESDSYRVIKGD